MSRYKRALLGWLLIGTMSVQAQNLYVFTVIAPGQTKSSDHELDRVRLRQFADSIARYGNYTQHWYNFGDSSAFTPQTVRSTLQAFKPQSSESDVFWLYFAGPGYSDGPMAWPTLRLNGGDIPLRDLLALLRQKPVRTLLVTVDCGNRPRQSSGTAVRKNAGQPRSTVVIPTTSRPALTDLPDMTVVDTYTQLFKPTNVRQIIIMASAGHGQQAYTDPKRGSIWLDAMTTAVTQTTQEKPAGSGWKQVQEKIVRQTQQRTRNRQTPLYTRQTITCCENEVAH